MSSAGMVCEMETGRRPVRDEVMDVFELCLDPLKVAIARLSDQDIREEKRKKRCQEPIAPPEVSFERPRGQMVTSNSGRLTMRLVQPLASLQLA